MSRRYIDEQVLDGITRLNGAIFFSILEALGPQIAARVADNMRDFGVLNSDNPYCEQLCNTLADAELEVQEGNFDFRESARISRLTHQFSRPPVSSLSLATVGVEP